VFLARPPRAPYDEWVRMNGSQWERCAFALDDQGLGVLRCDDSAPTLIPMSCLQEVRVHHTPDGAIDMLELLGRNGRSMAARPRPDLVDTMLARVWESNATITTTTADA
jgi:hypothetical protein